MCPKVHGVFFANSYSGIIFELICEPSGKNQIIFCDKESIKIRYQFPRLFIV